MRTPKIKTFNKLFYCLLFIILVEKADLVVLVCEDDLTTNEFMNIAYSIEDLHFQISQIPESIKYELIEQN
jgi:hypothetical protein